MRPFLDRIRQGEVLVADGAMGTMLFQRGLKPTDCPESVSLTRPDLLEEIATAYLEAGADIVQTNTFGGSPLKLAKYGLDDKTEMINRSAVDAVREAVDGLAYVSASVGPSGRILAPYGDIEPNAVWESFRRQIKTLVDAGADIICVETMTDIAEARLAIQATRSVSPTIPIMATMTYDETPRGFYTIMGIDIPTAVRELTLAGADLVGSNCGYGIEKMVQVARAYRACGRMPLVIQSNAGLPVMEDGRPVYREAPEFMAEKGKELVAIGVSVIGGCCGTTPAHIAAIRKMVDSLRPPSG